MNKNDDSQALGLVMGDRFVPVDKMTKDQLQTALSQAQQASHRRLEQAVRARLEEME